MRKIINRLILCLFLAFPLGASGETVSQKQASQIAELFFNAAFGEVTPPPKLVWNGRQLTTNRLFYPFYIYNSPRGGYVIISAENKAFPILAYSKKNNFDRSKLSEEENKMLQRYAREIEIVRYDSRVPERAVTAWQNLQGYISDVLQNPYSTPEYQSLGEDEKERLEEMDRLGSQILLPKAVEFALYDPDDFREYTLDDAIAEEDSVYEVPFKFYDDFVKTVKAEELAREISFEEVLNPSKPVVKNLGGAHYEIDIPQYAKMARIYAMDGSRQIEKYYADTRVVNLDLSALNNGFYVCMILTEDGKIYGLKLSR